MKVSRARRASAAPQEPRRTPVATPASANGRRPRLEEMREHRLLLVPAGEKRDGALDAGRREPEPLSERPADGALAPSLEEQAPAELRHRQGGERDVLADAALDHESFRTAVGREIDEPRVEHRAGRRPGHPPAEEAEGPAGDRLQAEARAADLRLAGPDEPRQTDNLARADRQGDIAHHAARRQTLHRQELALGTVVDPREERLDLPPGHQLDELFGGRVLHVERRDAVAVPEPGDAVADATDPVHP